MAARQQRQNGLYEPRDSAPVISSQVHQHLTSSLDSRGEGVHPKDESASTNGTWTAKPVADFFHADQLDRNNGKRMGSKSNMATSQPPQLVDLNHATQGDNRYLSPLAQQLVLYNNSQTATNLKEAPQP